MPITLGEYVHLIGADDSQFQVALQRAERTSRDSAGQISIHLAKIERSGNGANEVIRLMAKTATLTGSEFTRFGVHISHVVERLIDLKAAAAGGAGLAGLALPGIGIALTAATVAASYLFEHYKKIKEEQAKIAEKAREAAEAEAKKVETLEHELAIMLKISEKFNTSTTSGALAGLKESLEKGVSQDDLNRQRRDLLSPRDQAITDLLAKRTASLQSRGEFERAISSLPPEEIVEKQRRRDELNRQQTDALVGRGGAQALSAADRAEYQKLGQELQAYYVIQKAGIIEATHGIERSRESVRLYDEQLKKLNATFDEAERKAAAEAQDKRLAISDAQEKRIKEDEARQRQDDLLHGRGSDQDARDFLKDRVDAQIGAEKFRQQQIEQINKLAGEKQREEARKQLGLVETISLHGKAIDPKSAKADFFKEVSGSSRLFGADLRLNGVSGVGGTSSAVSPIVNQQSNTNQLLRKVITNQEKQLAKRGGLAA